MSDSQYEQFQQYGTAAERAAFTPSPAATIQPLYFWRETDTGLLYVYDTAWVLVGTTGTGAISKTVTTLTNAQVIALPTTPIQLIAAPAAGSRNRIIAASLVTRFTAGAYTNVNTTWATLQIQSAPGQWLAMPIFNDSSIPTTQLTTVMNAAQNRVINLLIPDVYPSGWVLDANIINDPADQDADATQIAIDNNGSGVLTGGNAANTLKVTLYYAVEAL